MLLTKQHSEDKKTLSRKIYSFVIIITITIFLLSSTLYINFENTIQYFIFTSEQSGLKQASYSAEIFSEFGKMLAKQVYYDSNIQKLRLFDYNYLSVDGLRTIYAQLDSYKALSGLIHSIYVYNSSSDILYATVPFAPSRMYDVSTFADKEIINLVNNHSTSKSLTLIPRRMLLPSNTNEKVYINVYSFIFFENQGVTKPTNGAVVINISEVWIKNTISQLRFNPNNNIFIIDRNGQIVLNRDNALNSSDITGNDYIKTILTSGKNSGYFIDKVDGTKSLIIYVTYEPLGWRYINIIPYNIISNKVISFKLTTILISGLVLFIGLLLAFIQSHKVFKPLNNILLRLAHLEFENRNNTNSLKQQYLKSLLLGQIVFDFTKDHKLIESYKINLQLQNDYCLVLLMIDNYSSFCNKHNLNDRNLIKFAIMNISSELCSDSLTNECLDMGEDKIAIIFNIPYSLIPDLRNHIANLMRNIQEQVNKILEISLSCFISHIGIHISGIKDLYDNTLSGSYQRFFHGHNCIVFSQEIHHKEAEEYVYPIQKEKAFIEALVTGNIDAAKIIYNEILEYTSQYSYATFYLMLTHLVFAINTAINNIKTNSGIKISCDINNFISRLKLLETRDEINNHFFGLFDVIISQLNNRKNLSYDKVVKKIIEMVNTDYSDENLCVKSISDSLNMSPAYISRLFKTATAKSIVDYINEVRMEKAKEFLLSTDLSINEIAIKVGFTNNQYFHRVFKKTFNVTPLELRRNEVL